MFKLYYAPGACSLAPHLVLQELKLPFKLMPVDLRAKTYSGGDFKAINPKGSVPALQLDNGEVLTEAGVILQYVADQAPDANLIPRCGTWERYRVQEWLNFISTEVHKGFGPLWNPDTPEAYKQIAIQNLSQRFDHINAQLGKADYLMGPSYTVADAYLFTVANWSRFFKLDLSPWPHVQKFLERVKQRPATIAAFAAEKLTK